MKTIADSSAELVILEQPVDKFRFRYKSEMHGTHGSLTASRSVKTNKTYPEVELRNFNKLGIIRCSLYQKNTLNPSFHSHLLVVHKEDQDVSDPHDFRVSPELGYIVRFENMGIVHTAKKDISKELLHKKIKKLKFDLQRDELSMKQMKSLKDEADREAKIMNLNQVCLCFEAFEVTDEGTYQKLCEPVYSNPINNLKSALTGELKICRLSMYTASVEGNDDLILLVEKVNKNNIKVRFFELKNEEEVWEAYGSFTEADVHHQYAIVVRTPPYRNKEIENHVNVFIELVRESDNKRSEPVPFRFKPKNILMSRKRRRISNSTSSASSFEMTQWMPNEIQKMKLEPRPNSICEKLAVNSCDSWNQNADLCNFNTFMEQVHVDSDELKTLFQESFLDFYMLDNELQLDGEACNKKRNLHISFHSALRLSMKTFNDCPRIGLEMTIKRIQVIFDSYAAQNDDANTIAHDLCKKSSQQEAKIFLRILSKLNLTHLFHQTNNQRQTPLHIACLFDQPFFIKLLLGVECDPNVQDIDGNTALHIAVRDNLWQCINGLVANIASNKLNVNLPNNEGMTPLHLAIRKDNIEMVKILLIKCDASVIYENSRDGNNALHLAVQQQNSEIFKIILENTDPENLKITNRAGHTPIDLAHTLKDPKREEILNLCKCLRLEFVDIKKEIDESSDSNSENEDMPLNLKILLKEEVNMNVKLPQEKEALIRARIQRDISLRKYISEILAINGKWKQFVKHLKLDHLLCIWTDAEVMLKFIFEVEGESKLKLLDIVLALRAVDEEAFNVLWSFILEQLKHIKV